MNTLKAAELKSDQKGKLKINIFYHTCTHPQGKHRQGGKERWVPANVGENRLADQVLFKHFGLTCEESFYEALIDLFLFIHSLIDQLCLGTPPLLFTSLSFSLTSKS